MTQSPEIYRPGRFRPEVITLVGDGGSQDLKNFAGQALPYLKMFLLTVYLVNLLSVMQRT